MRLNEKIPLRTRGSDHVAGLQEYSGLERPHRMLKKAVQQGRSEVRDAKNNERHVCGRRRGSEPAVSWAEASGAYPPTSRLPGQAFFPLRYVEGLNEATTQLASFSASC